MFIAASSIILLLLLFSALSPTSAGSFFAWLQGLIVVNGSWFYVLTAALILISVLILGFTSYGEIRLGPDHSTPDYSLISWFSMLFAAGMGIGLMYYGVAEPVMHFLHPPSGEAGSTDAAREAMVTTFFHWGLHAWAIYAIVGIILAYFSYRRGLPLTLRSALHPLIGDRIYGPIGHAVDVFAIIGTVFGVATSLGLGVLQISSGLSHLLDIPNTPTTHVILIVAVSGLAIASVCSGLDRGVRILSQFNIALAIALMLLVLLAGPSVFLLQAYVQNTGAYISDLVSKTFLLYAYEKTDWLGGWTILYWGWWISWAPFVGLFIARISRGRTLREFVTGVLLVPTLFTFLWMTVMGNSAIQRIRVGGDQALGEAVTNNVSVALFRFLESFAFSEVLSGLAVLMIVVFFVTSADSGALVVNMLCAHGNDKTPIWQRVYWGAAIAIVAVTLLLAGGLEALQTMTIASALPFALVLLVSIYGLFKALKSDQHKRDSLALPHPKRPQAGDWRERLAILVAAPEEGNVQVFLKRKVRPALKEIARAFDDLDIKSELLAGADSQTLTILHGEEIDFVYAVQCLPRDRLNLISDEVQQQEVNHDTNAPNSTLTQDTTWCAEVHLLEGGQNYDVMGWSTQALIEDILDQYQRHLDFLNQSRGR